MTQEQVIGILRHGLTILGGVLVDRGFADQETMTSIIGGILALAGVIWSIRSKIKKV